VHPTYTLAQDFLRLGCLAVPTRTPARKPRWTKDRIAAIVARRSELVAEIAQLRETGRASRFVENAQRLLTNWWSRSDWAGREELLKSAGWLVGLAKGAS
jgi:hypothetical protein